MNPQLQLRDEWYTPDDIFESIRAKYGEFDLDVAASVLNTKCKRFFTESDNGLSKDWIGTNVWCNHPYKRILDWVTKAHQEVLQERCRKVVMLLPSHTATTWFHYALEHGSVEFIKGKVKFGGSKGVPFFGSVIVVFGE